MFDGNVCKLMLVLHDKSQIVDEKKAKANLDLLVKRFGSDYVKVVQLNSCK